MVLHRIIYKNNLNISEIEQILLNWKINNISSYMNNISYIDDKSISFDIDIINIIYKFSINYIYIYDKYVWILFFNEIYNINNNIHSIISDMITKINDLYENININDLNNFMNIIEEIIEKYEFIDLNNDETNSIEDIKVSDNNEISSSDEQYLEIINELKIQEIKNDSRQINYNIDNNFKKLFDDIKNDVYNIYIDFDYLKKKAKKDIEKIELNKNKTLFNSEEKIILIINDIKNIIKNKDIHVEISDDIYNFYITYNSNILGEMKFNIILNTIEYPYYPPLILLTKPILKNDINYIINTMDYFRIDNWKSTNLLSDIITNIIIIIESNCEIKNNINYSCLSLLLSKLSIINKSKKINTDISQFKIFFNKMNLKKDNNNYWKEGTGYSSYESNIWSIKNYLKSNDFKIKNINEIINNLINNINDSTCLEEIKEHDLIDFLINNLTENLEISYLYTNEKYITNLIILTYKIYEFDNNIYSQYYDKINNTFSIINLINTISREESDIINKLYNCLTHITKLSIIKDKNNDNKYLIVMKKLQFMMIDNLDNICKTEHKLISNNRVIKEIALLSKSLPFDYNSSIYVRIDENNIQNINALIIPNSDTPYGCGCFIFHIYLPDIYPKNPPVVKLITTGNNTIRFNPNLYACGKVCLSLLGTWSGYESETWNDTSTILQVLVSIQSLIFIENPYYNEPGNEFKEEIEKSNEYNKQIKKNTILYAMIDVLKNPPKGFEEIIKNHFKYKKEDILEQVKKWELPKECEQLNLLIENIIL